MCTTTDNDASQVQYNPSEVTFEELVTVFLNRIDPTQKDGQGGDWGTQYRTGIYYHTEKQEAAVSSSRWFGVGFRSGVRLVADDSELVCMAVTVRRHDGYQALQAVFPVSMRGCWPKLLRDLMAPLRYKSKV